MLIQSFVGIAIAIASGIGLTSFLNNSNEKEEASSLFVCKSILIGMTFASLIIMVIKLVARLYDDEAVEEISSAAVKQSKKKKLENKLKRKGVLESRREEVFYIPRKEEPVKLEEYLADEREDKLNITNNSNEDTHQVVTQDISIADERWVNVEKKERREMAIQDTMELIVLVILAVAQLNFVLIEV
ncbi:hypothetical protein K6025_00285 [Ehrlichia sp. JZT12]